MKENSLHHRILLALLEFPENRTTYHALMYKVWPSNKFPRAYRHSANGGPPGVAMVYGRALDELRRQGLLMRVRRYLGGEEERYGQEDVQLLSPGRKALKQITGGEHETSRTQ